MGRVRTGRELQRKRTLRVGYAERVRMSVHVQRRKDEKARMLEWKSQSRSNSGGFPRLKCTRETVTK